MYSGWAALSPGFFKGALGTLGTLGTLQRALRTLGARKGALRTLTEGGFGLGSEALQSKRVVSAYLGLYQQPGKHRMHLCRNGKIRRGLQNVCGKNCFRAAEWDTIFNEQECLNRSVRSSTSSLTCPAAQNAFLKALSQENCVTNLTQGPNFLPASKFLGFLLHL